MASSIRIVYNPRTNKLEIFTPPWLGDVANGLPSRRWQRTKKVWLAPAVRSNCEYIMSRMADADISEEAAIIIMKSMERPHLSKGVFPSWYRPKTVPYFHQEKALEITYGLDYAALFMGCGTGKSKVAIDTACARAQEGKIDSVLVICPFSIRNNWLKEIGVHSPLPYEARVLKFNTKKAQMEHAEFLTKGDCVKWLILGTESLAAGRAIEWAEKYVLSNRCMVVVDESSWIKNHKANRTDRCIQLGLLASHRMAMTGTPITQGVLDLFSQFEFLDPQIIGMGDYYSFRNTYAIMGGHAKKEVIGYQNLDGLMDDIRPYVYQVSTEEALPDLPPKTYQTRSVEMSKQQKVLYNEISKNMVVPQEGGEGLRVKNALEKALRLQQVAGGHYPVENYDYLKEDTYIEAVPIEGKNPKIEELINMTGEMDGAPTIVWCRFVPEIKAVAAALRKKYGDDAVVEFYGDVDYDTRWENIEKFESGKARFFVGNPFTGGIGIDLIAKACKLAYMYVVYFSNSFSYETRHQSEARAWRSGQEKNVFYIDLVCSNSIDLHIISALGDKHDLAEYVKENIARGADPLALQ